MQFDACSAGGHMQSTCFAQLPVIDDAVVNYFNQKCNVPKGQQKDNISVWSRIKYFSSSMNAERLDIILPIVGSNMNE